MLSATNLISCTPNVHLYTGMLVKVWRKENSRRLGKIWQHLVGLLPSYIVKARANYSAIERDYEEVASDSPGDDVEEAEY